MDNAKKIKVLVVDDSAVVRQVVGKMLTADKSIDLIGLASDPIFAMEKMQTQWPDVIVLDVEMPRMDGITFLRKIMAERPTPVVVCSTLTEKGAETTMQALSAGAFTIITKPKVGLKNFLEDAAEDLLSAVKAAAAANPRLLRSVATPARAPVKLNADAVLPPAGHRAMAETTDRLVAIGTSTGGTQALEAVLAVSRAGDPASFEMVPALHAFTDPPMTTNQAAIRTFWNGQLYLTLGEGSDGTTFLLRMWWKPFVTLIWGGGALIGIGGALALLGRVAADLRRIAARAKIAYRRERQGRAA